MNATKNTYGQPSIGCYLDQGNRNSTDHDTATVRLAMDFGFEPDVDGLKLLARADNDCLSTGRDDAQCLSELADEAADWLNSQETRPYLYWANDGDAGAFGLWPNVDGAKEDGIWQSGDEDADPEDSDYPAADFRGEWLHVSDHGNCTLYVRKDSAAGFADVEVWSVV